jgi:hypothetical protein
MGEGGDQRHGRRQRHGKSQSQFTDAPHHIVSLCLFFPFF